MKKFEAQRKKEIVRMELINIYYMNDQHNARITESPKETINQYHFMSEYKYIKPKETFLYKVYGLN